MKVFISWSGLQSQRMAESLKSWLRDVIQTVDPFVSSLDIAKGDRGLPVIATQLEHTSFGIVCVTRENSLKPWINFEAGALSKAVGDARVIPFLLDMPVSDLTGPLTQFQVVSSAQKDDVFDMVRALRDHSGLADLDDDRLRRTFNAFWPDMEADLEAARSMQSNGATVTPIRDPGDILEEVLVIARRQENVLRTIIERVDSPVPMRELRRPQASGADKTDSRREVVDELIADLDIPADRALTYRVITDRIPEELQVGYDTGTIDEENADQICAQIEAFVGRRGVHVTIKSADGYQIIAGPGKETVLLAPAVVPAGTDGPTTAEGATDASDAPAAPDTSSAG
ncbi:TIR domain-containing protein [Streptomyces sp. CA-106131]|uniref:TIR domain-containing protein n=1 Tax=Streptomyces sp. CA-106131 TaxID=3240045 RepID=UPI003D92BFD2